MYRLARRSVVAARDIPEGTSIEREMLTTKRPGFGVAPKYIDVLVGRRAGSTSSSTTSSPGTWCEQHGGICETLALGTVQLGMPYGILRTEPPPESDVAELLEAAWHEGIRYFDTAEAYGDSEELLGTHLPARRFADARIITKLHPHASEETGHEIERRLERSLARLGRRGLWALLLHRDRMLERWDDGLGEVLQRWRADGLIRHLGVSAESFQRLPARWRTMSSR